MPRCRPRTPSCKSVVDRREAEMDYLKAQTKELREEGAVVSERDRQGQGRRLGDQDQGPAATCAIRHERIWSRTGTSSG
ncbi:MAG: hypothetical protein MZV65_53565 [Chromatiales bacterium]|nr:hypothetical protein [Chromatiales bacterium]